MNAHTPGPWRLTETFVEGRYGSSDRWICEITCPNNNLIVAEIPEYRTYPEETAMVEANARLIAAAPEMLNALEHIAGSCEFRATEIARVAIAKARGEA